MATRPQMRAALGVGGKQLLLGGYVARAAGVGGGWPPARWGGDGRYVHWWRAAAVVGRVGVSGRRLRRRAAVYVGCVVSRGVGGVARRLVLGRGAALDAGTGGGHLQAAKGCVALAVSAATTATADVLGGGAAVTVTGGDVAAVLAAGATPFAVGGLAAAWKGGVGGCGVGRGVLLGESGRYLFFTALATVSSAPAAPYGDVAPGVGAVAGASGTASVAERGRAAATAATMAGRGAAAVAASALSGRQVAATRWRGRLRRAAAGPLLRAAARRPRRPAWWRRAVVAWTAARAVGVGGWKGVHDPPLSTLPPSPSFGDPPFSAAPPPPSAAPPPPTHVGRRRPPPAEWGRRRWPVAARLGWRPAANRLRRVGGRPGVSWATVAVSWARERWCCVAGGGPPWSRPPQPPAAPLLPRAPPLWR